MSWLHHTKRTTARILFPYAWHYFTDDYKDRTHHLVVDTIGSFIILLLLGINVVIGAWLYLFSIPPEVEVNLTAPDLVISGEELIIAGTITAKNKTIDDIDLQLVLPETFQVTEDALSVELRTIARGNTEEFTVSGKFTGNVKQTYRAIVLYSYKYYGQSFAGSSLVEFVVDTSSLEVIAHVPEHILNNESFTWTVEYHNSSAQERQQVCIQLDLPSSFQIDSSTVPITDNQIILETIPANTSGAISITGSFSNAIGEGNHVIGVAGIDQCGDKALRQTALQQAVEVLTPRLQITTTGPATANVGDLITYQVNYINTGDAVLDNITTTVRLDNGALEQWTDGALAPGERRTKTFTRTVSAATRQKNLAISHSVSAVATIADVGIQTYTPSFSYQTLFNSTLRLSHVARYNSTTGEQLGYGPYPLRAWEVTALRVFWQVEDFTNDLSNVTITTTLPSQVEWTGYSAVTEGGAMTYDAGTRTVTWHTSSIPSFSHAQGASFEVRILPNSDQAGKAINITNDLYFSARDSFTGAVIIRTLGALRTPPIEAEKLN